MSFADFEGKLNKLEAAHLRRQRHTVSSNKDGIIEISGKHYINFASNDYLGLSQNEQVLQSYVEGLAVYGSGSGASPLVTGHGIEHSALEDDICQILNKPAAILFSSGFAANQALCHALFGLKTDQNSQGTGHIICDKLMHASFIQGALESNPKLSRFKHNDMAHAQRLLQSLESKSNVLLASEGVFSMDGDCGDIQALQSLIQAHVEKAPKSQNRPWLMIDEAHAIGVIGENGFGSLDTKQVDEANVDIVMGTFGKAIGSSGAFIAGSLPFIEFMINTSKHYIYSTAFSQAQARAIRMSLSLIEIGKEREILHNNIAFFRQQAHASGLVLLDSNTPIQALVLGSPEVALSCAAGLQDLGMWVPCIRTPTVPKHSDRLRITISALHTQKDLQALVDSLQIVVQQFLQVVPCDDA